MDNLIDIHNHIIYGVDDGSENLAQSQNMLKIAYGEGIRKMILTPHHNPYRWQVDPAVLHERFDQLKEYAGNNFPGMELYLGSEIYYGNDTLQELGDGWITTMAHSNYVLVEFSPYTEYDVISRAVIDIQQNGFYPIIAHVERYECIVEDPECVDMLKDYGAFIQINASSVVKDYGRAVRKFIKGVLKKQQVDFVATDAHGDEHRAPVIAKCAQHIKKHFGEAYAYRIMRDNPASVIAGTYIED